MDPVLTGARPRLTAAEAVEITATTYGVSARDLESERDRRFLLLGDGHAPVAVLKASNSSEDPG